MSLRLLPAIDWLRYRHFLVFESLASSSFDSAESLSAQSLKKPTLFWAIVNYVFPHARGVDARVENSLHTNPEKDGLEFRGRQGVRFQHGFIAVPPHDPARGPRGQAAIVCGAGLPGPGMEYDDPTFE